MCIIKYYSVHCWVSSVNNGHVKSSFITSLKLHALVSSNRIRQISFFNRRQFYCFSTSLGTQVCVNAHMWVCVCLPCVFPSLIFLKRWSAKQTHTHIHSSRHGMKSVRCLLCVEKACVNFLWPQKEASVCTAFNNELKGNSGHVTQMKEEMPSVVFFLHCSCAIHSALLTYFAQGNC